MKIIVLRVSLYLIYLEKRNEENMKRIVLSCLPLFGFIVQAHASDWSDTYLGYRYGTSYREPQNRDNITKNILSLTHISGYKYGTNFFNVDMLSSDGKDPASGGGGGAQEVYVVYRTTLSMNSLGVPVKTGIIRDLGLTAGFDYNAKDDQFSSRVEKYSIGPKVSFEIPQFKYFDLSVLYRTEHNHNWYATQTSNGTNVTAANYPCGTGKTCTNGDIYFKPTFALELAWGLPFEVSIVPLKFQGFANYIGEKGDDAAGNATKPETLVETSLMVDVGSFAGQKETFYVGPGYQYWHNKFGNDASADSSGGATASVFQAEAEVHF